MKILQINSVYNRGSTGKIVRDLHCMLIEQGNVSMFAFGRGNDIKDRNAIKIGNDFTVFLDVLNSRIFDKQGFASKRNTLNLIEKIKKNNPSIIHIHNLHGYYINLSILFKYINELNIPVIWTLHDCWAFTGHCTYFDYIDCNQWKTTCLKCPQIMSYPKSYFDNSTKNFCSKLEIYKNSNITIVTPSKWLLNLVHQSILGNHNILCINNGIDLKVFKYTKNSFKNDNNIKDKYIILGVASKWEKRKGLHFFVELSKLLSCDEIIVMVGVSKKQRVGLPSNILFIDKTSSACELAEIYSSADVFLNPTLEDNFPTTNLEALACGTPIITFDTGGSPEAINLDTGIVVEHSVEALRDAIDQMRNRDREELRNICIESSKKFDKTLMYQQYISLYQKILLEKKTS